MLILSLVGARWRWRAKKVMAELPPIRTFGRIRSRPVKGAPAALLKTLLLRCHARGPVRSQGARATRREVWLEIGFGGGEHLAAQAARNGDVLLIGAEAFVKRGGQLPAPHR